MKMRSTLAPIKVNTSDRDKKSDRERDTDRQTEMMARTQMS